MEGIGSRLGRVSSRYGSAPAAFTGPVRRWKKQWIHISSSSSSSSSSSLSYHTTTTTTTTTSAADFHSNNENNAVRLRRWTPVPSSPSTDSATPDDRPRRKLRYTPIVEVEVNKRGAGKKTSHGTKASKTNQLVDKETPENDETEEAGYENKEKTQASSKRERAVKHVNHRNMDLDLGLKAKEGGSDDDGCGEEAGKMVTKKLHMV